MGEMISSHSNPLVKQIRALRQKKARDESGLFLVEGIHHVGEALEAGWDVETLVYAPDLLESDFARQLVEQRQQTGKPNIAMTAALFSDLAEKENPAGILAIARQKHLDLQAIDKYRIHFAAALVSPQDPGNVGTILRTLDAVGGDALFQLEGGVDLYHPSLIRASMGTIFWKPVARVSFGDFVQWAHAVGIKLVGSSAHASTSYEELKHAGKPAILILGSEQKGLTAEQLGGCDLTVALPMRGRASSLNLAVAAGILLYQMMD